MGLDGKSGVLGIAIAVALISYTRRRFCYPGGSASAVLVLLCHGGYFSAAMFVGGRCVAHKSLHRFISQSPNGGARRGSSKNKGGRKAIRGSKGAAGGSGSYLAMYNEGKHLREVRTLLATEVWAEHVATASVILVHAPGPVNTVRAGADSVSWRGSL